MCFVYFVFFVLIGTAVQMSSLQADANAKYDNVLVFSLEFLRTESVVCLLENYL